MQRRRRKIFVDKEDEKMRKREGKEKYGREKRGKGKSFRSTERTRHV